MKWVTSTLVLTALLSACAQDKHEAVLAEGFDACLRDSSVKVLAMTRGPDSVDGIVEFKSGDQVEFILDSYLEYPAENNVPEETNLPAGALLLLGEVDAAGKRRSIYAFRGRGGLQYLKLESSAGKSLESQQVEAFCVCGFCQTS